MTGRPPSAASVLPAVVERLHAAGADVAVQLAPDGDVPATVRPADLVVLRALAPLALERLRSLEQGGTRCCNTVAATLLARDKAAAMRALAAAGVPVPATRETDGWAEAARAAAVSSGIVKARFGSRGVDVLDGRRLPAAPPFRGPYLVQDRVHGDGWDRKLYAVGTEVRGVRRRWPAETLAEKVGAALAPGRELRELTLAAGAALGLELFGVDVVVAAGGPVVVDVNAFPGYKGVPDAAELLASYLAGAAAEEVAPCAS